MAILAVISWNITEFIDFGQGLLVNFLGFITLTGIFWSFYYLISERRNLRGAKWAIVIGQMISVTAVLLLLIVLLIETLFSITIMRFEYLGVILTFLFFVSFPLSQLIYVCWWLIESRREIQTKTEGLLKAEEEKRIILDNQKAVLEGQVKERTAELNHSLENLNSTQSQLIHSEKMASLGELTAGIAHEIQNPLNFVNNFSEVNKEMLDELNEAIENNDQEEIKAILKDLKENEEKVTHHGKRAEGIVKSMLQHSRTGSGEKELTDINALCDEYLRLAYHGFKAKDSSFSAEFKLELDESLPKINVVPQDMGRVLLNLINNAFQAVSENPSHPEPVEGDEGTMTSDVNYSPTVQLKTQKLENSITITIADNGPGIPEHVRDKIFEPFFTTKPTGEGTGLGLSMSYDIVSKGHGGTIGVKLSSDSGTTFLIEIPA
ncbi:MAG: histidine kinase [Cyclobacteriaceae bacterium]